MPIKFEGDPPYDLPFAQSAEARSEGEIVELILTVDAPGIQPARVLVRIPMTWATARALGGQLRPVSDAAERRARQRGR
jgi:hypothetical protein